jgi:carboxypeptidase Q
MVPHWVRGAEAGAIVAPIQRDLVVLGLGGTVATPKGGLTAPVIAVTSWDDLKAKADQVKGKIVLYDVAMPPYDAAKNDTHYGDVVPFRWAGAAAAAKLGAVAVLVRSVTAHSLRTPHTGAMGYEDGVKKIPALAVTVEDATLLHRLADEGEVKVHVLTSGKQLPDAPSANVIGELRGSDKPDEIVVIGGHLDSWDVGQGAHDDGAGIVTCMEALTVIRKLGLHPRRTIRVVLFTNEENGLRGGKGYALAHKDELAKHVAALESDLGAFPPAGFEVMAAADVKDRVVERLGEVASLLADIGATDAHVSEHAGADVEPMGPAGVTVVGLDVRAATYFDVHHTPADTFDKIDPEVLADDVAAVAVWAFIVADLPDRLDAPAAAPAPAP